MTTYRAAAVAFWGDAGRYVYDTYDRLRGEYFPELPDQLPIVIGITAYGACLGLTRERSGDDVRITIASNLFKRGHRAVDDVLVHELLHAELMPGDDAKHDSRPWYDAVRCLSPRVLGHDLDVRRGGDRRSVRMPNPRAGAEGQPATVVRKVRIGDAVQHGDVARWPSAFRPADYDWGEPIPCPSY